MTVTKDQKAAYNNATLKQAKAWDAPSEKTMFICSYYEMRVRELDAIVNSDGLTFQDWLEAKFMRLLKR